MKRWIKEIGWNTFALLPPPLWYTPTRLALRGAGHLKRVTSRAWWPYAKLFALSVLLLVLLPVVLHYLAELVQNSGLAKRFGVHPAPHVGDWLSLADVAGVFIALVTLRALILARRRVVVEAFVHHSAGEPPLQGSLDSSAAPPTPAAPHATREHKPGNGLATLLIADLARLARIYQEANMETGVPTAIPTAVGVQRDYGSNRVPVNDANSFLLARADELTPFLEGAVALDATLEIGKAKLPLGAVVALLNRLARGPRVVGSLHATGGGLTLTAQLIGPGRSETWRVDSSTQESPGQAKEEIIDTMVGELAIRMFTELTVRGMVRSQAIAEFARYLELVNQFRSTPWDRIRFLKQAEATLLKAIAADDTFDLAFYNLGVVYTKLGEVEKASALSLEPIWWFTPDTDRLGKARSEAARVAFWKATRKPPSRWEAHYALAATHFAMLEKKNPTDRATDTASNPTDLANDTANDRELLRRASAGCVHAGELARQSGVVTPAVVRQLEGLVALRRNEHGLAIRRLRYAAAGFWLELCQAEEAQRADPRISEALPRRAKHNAVAALQLMGVAYAQRADGESRPARDARPGGGTAFASLRDRSDLVRANGCFRYVEHRADASMDAPVEACFERAKAFQCRRRMGQAVEHYERAANQQGSNAAYVAALARALAMRSREDLQSRVAPRCFRWVEFLRQPRAWTQSAVVAEASQTRRTTGRHHRLASQGVDISCRKGLVLQVIRAGPGQRGTAAGEVGSSSRVALWLRVAVDVCPTRYVALRARGTPATHSKQRGAEKFKQRAQDDAQRAQEEAARALQELGPVFRRSVLPRALPWFQEHCDRTLDILEDTYWWLNDDEGERRIREIKKLRKVLTDGCAETKGLSRKRSDDSERKLTNCLRQHDQFKEALSRIPFDEASSRISFGQTLGVWELVQIDMALARIRIHAEEWNHAEESLSYAQQLLKEYGESQRVVDFGLLPELARVMRKSGRLDEANVEISDALRRGPLNARGRREAGRVHFELGQYEEALQYWEQAQCLVPGDAGLGQDMAICQWRLASHDRDEQRRERALREADERLQTVLELLGSENPVASAWAHIWRGRVALERDHVDDAIRAFHGAAHACVLPGRQSSANWATWQALGDDQREALNDQLGALSRASIAALLFLGEAYLTIKQYDPARDTFSCCYRVMSGKEPKENLETCRTNSVTLGVNVTRSSMLAGETSCPGTRSRCVCCAGLSRRATSYARNDRTWRNSEQRAA